LRTDTDLDRRLADLGDHVGAATAPVEIAELNARTRPSKTRRHAIAIAAGVVTIATASAVGLGVVGTDGDTSVHAMPANAAWFAVVAPADDQATDNYSSCMLDAGYDTDAIGPPSTGPIRTDSIWSDVDYRRAFDRCIVESGIGDVVGDDPEEVAAKNAKAIGITACMRDQGWAMPEPTRHPVHGYLVPGGPDVPTATTDAQQQLDDLTTCGAKYDVIVFD
jgi:hypothetical protein